MLRSGEVVEVPWDIRRVITRDHRESKGGWEANMDLGQGRVMDRAGAACRHDRADNHNSM